MLVKFHSSESGELMMFAETARVLLRLLEKECTARGVITNEELPEKIAKLQAAIARSKTENKDAPAANSEGELPIGLAQRATPFLELLQRSRTDKGYILWEAPADFGG
jgi:uncharacterized small protein (DUF1192 family)